MLGRAGTGGKAGKQDELPWSSPSFWHRRQPRSVGWSRSAGRRETSAPRGVGKQRKSDPLKSREFWLFDAIHDQRRRPLRRPTAREFRRSPARAAVRRASGSRRPRGTALALTWARL